MPFSIAVFQDTLYWSDYKTEGIYAANKVTGENAIVVVKDLRQPTGINILHAALNQPGLKCSIIVYRVKTRTQIRPF